MTDNGPDPGPERHQRPADEVLGIVTEAITNLFLWLRAKGHDIPEDCGGRDVENWIRNDIVGVITSLGGCTIQFPLDRRETSEWVEVEGRQQPERQIIVKDVTPQEDIDGAVMLRELAGYRERIVRRNGRHSRLEVPILNAERFGQFSVATTDRNLLLLIVLIAQGRITEEHLNVPEGCEFSHLRRAAQRWWFYVLTAESRDNQRRATYGPWLMQLRAEHSRSPDALEIARQARSVVWRTHANRVLNPEQRRALNLPGNDQEDVYWAKTLSFSDFSLFSRRRITDWLMKLRGITPKKLAGMTKNVLFQVIFWLELTVDRESLGSRLLEWFPNQGNDAGLDGVLQGIRLDLLWATFNARNITGTDTSSWPERLRREPTGDGGHGALSPEHEKLLFAHLLVWGDSLAPLTQLRRVGHRLTVGQIRSRIEALATTAEGTDETADVTRVLAEVRDRLAGEPVEGYQPAGELGAADLLKAAYLVAPATTAVDNGDAAASDRAGSSQSTLDGEAIVEGHVPELEGDQPEKDTDGNFDEAQGGGEHPYVFNELGMAVRGAPDRDAPLTQLRTLLGADQDDVSKVLQGMLMLMVAVEASGPVQRPDFWNDVKKAIEGVVQLPADWPAG